MTQVSVIVTILNGAKWIDKCFESIARQTAVQQHEQQRQAQNPFMSYVPVVKHNNDATNKATLDNNDDDDDDDVNDFSCTIEVCVFDDCSTDATPSLLVAWQHKFKIMRIDMRIVRNESGKPKGVGYGRNMAIAMAIGAYLCFQDIDDEMMPSRILKQYALAKRHKDAIIGSKFTRIPPHSTCRFSHWANELLDVPSKLALQIYTSNGPTVIMPTWFCHRNVYDQVSAAINHCCWRTDQIRMGGFCVAGHGTPEDLIFFYQHLDVGGRILRVNEPLLKYRYHPEATTFSIAAKTIRGIRMQHLISHQLSAQPWLRGFTIWNAGKQGRQFFRDLPTTEQAKVVAFCDVDKKKINQFYRHFDETKRNETRSIPIVHFTKAQPPLIICMKLDLTNGAFEANLRSLNLTEGVDYILFT